MSNEPTAEDFDPLLALHSEEKLPIFNNAKVYDNVAVFEANLKRAEKGDSKEKTKKKLSHKEKSFSQRKKLAAEVKNRDVSKLKEMMEHRKKIDEGKASTSEDVETAAKPTKGRKPPSNLFTVMEKLSLGPTSLIHRIMNEHLPCHVYMRNFHGICGVLVGFVVAFDRYMNLAMVDVDETFALPPLGEVAKHQKRLSVAHLQKALEDIKLYGLEEAHEGTHPCNHPHLPTSGASVVKRTQKQSNSGVANSRKPEPSTSSTSRTSHVKLYDFANPLIASKQAFHGGSPQLYHRHINHLYVRGDNIVLISLPT